MGARFISPYSKEEIKTTRSSSVRDEERARGATQICRDLTAATSTVFGDQAS